VPGWEGRMLPPESSGDELPVGPGQALVFPMAVPAGNGTARSGRVPGPWGPIGKYLECTSNDASSSVSLTIGFEWPFTPHGVSSDLTKPMAEMLQLQLYVQDWWEGRGSPPFVLIEQGDRPDFRVRTLRGDLGIDMSRLTSEERRRAQHLFSYVRSSIREDPESFTHLRGHVVAMWFSAGDVPATGLPPARADQATRDLMLRHLRALNPTAVASHVQAVTGLNGAGTSFTLMRGLSPGTGFFDACGFELALAYSTQHRAADVWDEIGRVSVQHDYEGADRLVISVGAPAAPFGEATPADYLLWGVAERSARWPAAPKLEHLQIVDVHDWWLGSITRVYPEWDVLVPPRRSGPVFPIRTLGHEHEAPVGWSISAFTERPHRSG
jgi:hypothetical protein